jgi:hypothetical protein
VQGGGGDSLASERAQRKTYLSATPYALFPSQPRAGQLFGGHSHASRPGLYQQLEVPPAKGTSNISLGAIIDAFTPYKPAGARGHY